MRVYTADLRRSTLFLGHFQAVQIIIDDFEQLFHPDLSLSCSIYYIYSMQIIHSGTHLINGSVTHYIHVIRCFSIAFCGSCLYCSVPSTLLTPGGVEFMVHCSGPQTASEFIKLISELIEHCGFLIANILWHIYHNEPYILMLMPVKYFIKYSHQLKHFIVFNIKLTLSTWAATLPYTVQNSTCAFSARTSYCFIR